MTVWAEVQGSTVIAFPYTLGSLMAENPFTNFGNDPDLAAVFPSTETAMTNGYTLAGVRYLDEPQHDKCTQTAAQNALPHLEGAEWVLGWTVSAKSADEISAADAEKAKAVRSDRNTRLSASDWTQVADAPVDKAAWATYRQALRDLTTQSGFPWEVTWPSEPT